MLEDFFRKLKDKNELYLKIKVRPGAVKNEIKSRLDDDTLKIDIAAPPERGKANVELTKFLAKSFLVSKDNVAILSGAGDKLKLVKIVK